MDKTHANGSGSSMSAHKWDSPKTLINRKNLLAMIPLSDRTIFNMERRGEFPRRIVLTSRNVAWDLAEIEAWIMARRSSSAQPRRPGLEVQTLAQQDANP